MDIGDIDPQEWAAAQRRAEVLSKLPERPSGERPGLAAHAGVGASTSSLRRLTDAKAAGEAPRRRQLQRSSTNYARIPQISARFVS